MDAVSEQRGKALWKIMLLFGLWLVWVGICFAILYAFRFPIWAAALAALPLGMVCLRMRVMCELLGAVLGAVLGFFAPIIYAYIYVARGGDPTGAGALWIFCFITIPAGILIGAVVGFFIRRFIRWRE